MQYFCAFFVTKRGMFLISILILLLYGFPSCCDDDNVTNADDTAANCRYEIEEEGVLYQEHFDDYHPWVFFSKSDQGDITWDLTNPSFVPDGNLANMYKVDSLRVRITGVRAPANIDNPVRLWAWPFIILHIEKLD